MASTPDTHFDVAVIGAGPAGLACALLLARSGVNTVAFGPRDANAEDTRTTALFAGAVRMLENAGIWSELCDLAAPLERLRIVDRVSRPDHPSVVLFDAAEISDEPFGHNIANTPLVRALEDGIAKCDGALRVASPVSDISHADDSVQLTTGDGASYGARLVVAADGRRSLARQAAGIEADDWDYGQLALATRISHATDHQNISTEIHRPGGPLTTVPLPGLSSAIVWLDRTAQMDAVAGMNDGDFEKALARELDGLLGKIALDGARAAFPVRGLSVSTLAQRRTVLVGEAAHVVPPIGAQGLNLGLRDAAWIADIAATAVAGGNDPGSDVVLARYRDARRGDVVSRLAASDLLNRSLLLDFAVVRGLRGLGLTAIANVGPLRRQVMRAGLIRNENLPPAMRAP